MGHYTVSKVFGEAIGYSYANRHDMEVRRGPDRKLLTVTDRCLNIPITSVMATRYASLNRRLRTQI